MNKVIKEVDELYPVGSSFLTLVENDQNPAEILGGEWKYVGIVLTSPPSKCYIRIK